jgi:hypothetical protein
MASVSSGVSDGGSDVLASVPDVIIEDDGVFKYVLIRVTAPGGKSKRVVRG